MIGYEDLNEAIRFDEDDCIIEHYSLERLLGECTSHAPLSRQYDDLWALGILVFQWWNGYHPFESHIFNPVAYADILATTGSLASHMQQHSRAWKDPTSDTLKAFLGQLVSPHPEQRGTCMSLLAHDWLVGFNFGTDDCSVAQAVS